MLNSVSVLIETRIVSEFLREVGLAGKLFVLAQHLSDCPHDAVSDSDTISGNVARIGLSELFLQMGKEEAPLISDNLLPCGVLLFSTIEAENNRSVGGD